MKRWLGRPIDRQTDTHKQIYRITDIVMDRQKDRLTKRKSADSFAHTYLGGNRPHDKKTLFR